MNASEVVINPAKDSGEPELPRSGLLLINPEEARRGISLAEQKKGSRHFLFNSSLAVIPGNDTAASIFIAGPSIGAPMAVMTLEKLVALGAQNIIVYGWCGSLNRDVRTGDVVLPTWAESSEGTSAHYPVNGKPESHGPTRELLAGKLADAGLKVIAGPVWTTDAPYRETVSDVKTHSRNGVLGVEMEYGALAAAAAFRNVELSAVLLVSDELFTGEWHPGFRTKKFRQASRELLGLLVETCQKLNGK